MNPAQKLLQKRQNERVLQLRKTSAARHVPSTKNGDAYMPGSAVSILASMARSRAIGGEVSNAMWYTGPVPDSMRYTGAMLPLPPLPPLLVHPLDDDVMRGALTVPGQPHAAPLLIMDSIHENVKPLTVEQAMDIVNGTPVQRREGESPLAFQRRLRASPVTETRIGVWDGYCNRRSVCRQPHARWWNRGSYSHYCFECAMMLNRVNERDAEELLGAGESLCIEMRSAEHYPTSNKGHHHDGD